MLQSLLPFILGLFLIGFGVLVLILSLRSVSVNEMSQRLQEYVVDRPVTPIDWTPTTTVRKAEVEGSFRTRVVLPFFRRLGGFFGRLMPSQSLDEISHQLVIAGNPLGLGAREYYGLRILFIVLGVGLTFMFLRRGFIANNLVLSGLALYICFLLPRAWLHRLVRRRQDKIRKGLPDALDMLSVCAEAGLGFDQSLQRVSEYWKTPLGAEFGRVVAEMEMGVSRQAALRNMSDKLDVPELSSFVAVIIQSDQLGMSIADTLRGQAQQMRIERRFRAQEQARKVPLKMLFPMILLIFPAMLAVICGPVIPVLIDFFRTLQNSVR